MSSSGAGRGKTRRGNTQERRIGAHRTPSLVSVYQNGEDIVFLDLVYRDLNTFRLLNRRSERMFRNREAYLLNISAAL